MNPENIVVRIEKIAGNFQKDKRQAIIDTVAELVTKDTAPLASAPLTDGEISALRDSLRGKVKTSTAKEKTSTAKTAADEPPAAEQLRPDADADEGKKPRTRKRK